MLKLNSVSKRYAKSDTYAVNDVNIHVKSGEIYGFIGPNGAGKTTTIKMIIGVLAPSEGNIEVNGADISREGNYAKKHIGYVSDSHTLYDRLTGKEYVNFLADVYGVGQRERQERCERLLELFAMKDAFNSQISTYSHGMKQKISIIGALIHEPPVWVLDEPMTGLDPQSSHVLKTLMREHCDKGNVVFFSTHVLEVAEKLCDRVGIISEGKLIAQGSLDEIQADKDKSLEEIFLALTQKE
ncbi:MAG: ABC transporter ATP-binding protein [Clostridiales bacterium]|nr:ABC transporter ATP-binding protein [Clostridiales bacterium]